MSPISDKLQALRIKWTKATPAQRPFIERQARMLQKAQQWYTEKRQLEQKVAEAKSIFSVSSNNEEVSGGTAHE